MNCPACGAPMRLKQDAECFVCDYCLNVYIPEPNSEGVRVFGEPAAQSCPICAIALVEASVAGVRIRYCKRCHGMLISMDYFEAVIQGLRARHEPGLAVLPPLDWKDLDRRIHCPQCAATMDAHAYAAGGNVVMDSCENCGLNWLDYGELDRIVRAPDPRAEPLATNAHE